jgi:hypothetical protein
VLFIARETTPGFQDRYRRALQSLAVHPDDAEVFVERFPEKKRDAYRVLLTMRQELVKGTQVAVLRTLTVKRLQCDPTDFEWTEAVRLGFHEAIYQGTRVSFEEKFYQNCDEVANWAFTRPPDIEEYPVVCRFFRDFFVSARGATWACATIEEALQTWVWLVHVDCQGVLPNKSNIGTLFGIISFEQLRYQRDLAAGRVGRPNQGLFTMGTIAIQEVTVPGNFDSDDEDDDEIAPELLKG